MSSKLFSIVIPAYNAAATLPATLDAIIPQCGDDTEVIVVNDGSTDSTCVVVRNYCSRSELKLIDLPQNGGLANASATGIDAAEGDYILRCDADDVLPPGTLDAYRRAIAGRHPDMVAGRLRSVAPDGTVKLLTLESCRLNDLTVRVDNFTLCGRAIKRSLLQSAELKAFRGLDCWEDLGVSARLFAKTTDIVRIDNVTHEYRLAPRGRSLSTSRRERLLRDHIAVAQNLTAWFEERGLAQKFDIFLAHLKFAAKVKYMRGAHRNPSAWKSTFPEVNGRIMSLSHVSLVYRLLFTAVALLPTWVTAAVCRLADCFSSSDRDNA